MTNAFVSVEDNKAVDVTYRHQRTVKTPGIARQCGAALTFDSIGVDIAATVAPARGDDVGGNALRHEMSPARDIWVDGPGTAGGHHRHARHALDAAADNEVGLSSHDLRGGDVAGFQP